MTDNENPTNPMNPMQPECEQYTEALAELALGTLGGRERATVLEHVDNCHHCAAEVEDFSHALDALLSIAPAVEPPLGFEVRLFQRLGLAPPHRRRRIPVRTRRMRNSLLAAAALIVAVAGFATGDLLATSSPAKTQVAAAALDGVLRGAGGATIGQVVVTTGSPAWLYMYVEGNHHAQKFWCEVRLKNGHSVELGSFWTGNQSASWSSKLNMPASEIAGARLVSDKGITVATAKLVA